MSTPGSAPPTAHRPPPAAPGAGEVGWAGGLVWAASLGAAAGVTKLLVRREAQQRLEKRALVRRSRTAS